MVPGRAGKGGRGCHVFRIQIGGGRMFTNQIKTVNLDGISDFERIDSELRTLIVTMAGSLPGSRGFGLSAAFLSPTFHTCILQLQKPVKIIVNHL